jgi:hypothetical protein
MNDKSIILKRPELRRYLVPINMGSDQLLQRAHNIASGTLEHLVAGLVYLNASALSDLDRVSPAVAVVGDAGRLRRINSEWHRCARRAAKDVRSLIRSIRELDDLIKNALHLHGNRLPVGGRHVAIRALYPERDCLIEHGNCGTESGICRLHHAFQTARTLNVLIGLVLSRLVLDISASRDRVIGRHDDAPAGRDLLQRGLDLALVLPKIVENVRRKIRVHSHRCRARAALMLPSA